MDLSKAAAAMGRAGRGEAKRRGDSEHYRALVAKRKDRLPSRHEPEITLIVGESVIWQRIERGGYGYTTPVPVTVLKIGGRKVQVRAPLIHGGTRDVWVNPYNLHRVPCTCQTLGACAFAAR